MHSDTLQQLLARGQQDIAAALGLSVAEARIEAQCLLQYVLGVSRAHLLAHPEQRPDAPELNRYEELLRRRLTGEPVAYLLGEREFFGLMFEVTPATLIPRPETELLVELALQRIAEAAAASDGGGGEQRLRVLDMGTGSGAIALSIAYHHPRAEVMACDSSVAALAVARHNAGRLGIINAAFAHSDWYAALGAQRYHLIVSNPPYVAADDAHLQQGDLRFEPWSALASGADGLEDIRRIIGGARPHLAGGGWLLLEHGYDQAEEVRALLAGAGLGAVFSARDLAGIERVSGGQAAS
jgi:release factor glutamine methyltransferase